ncbi:MAG: putative DNA-binding protein [Parachlamydiales bacterium]|nr:putative DNA-binding protein [Parachlamydiales bacterium]
MTVNGEIILYTTEDGQTSIQLKTQAETVWLTRTEIAELFQITPQNVTLHIKEIYASKEAEVESTSKDYLLVQNEGARSIQRTVKLYNLNIILTIGYRVRSVRGIQFRKWATAHLQEYLIKGFVMDDARLKEPGGRDYFDEWLRRIREIRASEKRFYQKVRDIYATAVDYAPQSDQAQLFFKKVQNKMIWAITHKTAAELIVERSDSQLPNMGLTSWEGSRVRQKDVTIAKNYLKETEIEEINEIVVMYLDYAESQAKRRKTITMNEWAEKLDSFLSFNEKDLLNHAGKVSAQVAEKLAFDRYAEFNEKQRHEERLLADAEDIALLEAIQAKAKSVVFARDSNF